MNRCAYVVPLGVWLEQLWQSGNTLEAMAYLLPRMTGAQLEVVYNAAAADTRLALQRIVEMAGGVDRAFLG